MYSVQIIEDDATNRYYIERILRYEGFDVRSSPDGQSGLALLRENRPDLILCDIMMPDMDGHMVLDAVKSDPLLADIPFIFVSAKGENPDIRKGMLEGADDYLPKPFSAEELLATVTARIQRYEKILRQRGKAICKEEASVLRKKNITRREREVLLKVGQGASSKLIADQLGVSLKTIEMHRSNLMKKLGSTNAAGLTRWAVVAEQVED